ncbi:MAG: hypothetical protein ACYC9R_13040 [Nitrosotalea sp.]
MKSVIISQSPQKRAAATHESGQIKYTKFGAGQFNVEQLNFEHSLKYKNIYANLILGDGSECHVYAVWAKAALAGFYQEWENRFGKAQFRINVEAITAASGHIYYIITNFIVENVAFQVRNGHLVECIRPQETETVKV